VQRRTGGPGEKRNPLLPGDVGIGGVAASENRTGRVYVMMLLQSDGSEAGTVIRCGDQMFGIGGSPTGMACRSMR
jgi:hypothetical protein